MGRILLWTQNRQQLPTVWKQTVKQSRLLRLQHPIKCNLNQASHLFSIPFGSLLPISLRTIFTIMLVNPYSPRQFPNSSGQSTVLYCPRGNAHSSKAVSEGLTSKLLSTDASAVGSVHFSRRPPIPHPIPPAVVQITLQGYSGQAE